MPRRSLGWWLARAYAALVLLAAVWAWYVDVSMLRSEREHLLPDMLLMSVSWPTSLSLFGIWQQMTWPLAQLAWLTLCGALQAGLLCWLTRPRRMTRL